MIDFKFRISRFKKHLVANRELHAGHYVPCAEHWDSRTLITSSGSMIRVFKLDGFTFETADDEDLDVQNLIRNQLWRGLSSPSLSLKFHIFRRRESVFSDGFGTKPMQNYFANYVNEEWIKKHKNHQAFINELYITVVKKPKQSATGMSLIPTLLDKLQGGGANKGWENSMCALAEEMDEVCGRMVTSLKSYGPKVLGIEETEYGYSSQLLGFFIRIANCGLVTNVLAPPHADLSKLIPVNRLYFSGKTIQVAKADRFAYAGIVSIKEYGQNTSPGMFDSFLQLPYEFVMSQSYQFTSRALAISKMQIQQGRMLQSGDKSATQILEINEALDSATSGVIGFGSHDVSILCVEDDPKSLENAMSLVETELSNCGLYPVRERINLEPAFWGQLPGNEDFLVRKATVSTLNLSGFASLHNHPVGKKFGNHWGDAVTVFDTTSGTPYFFNFHVRDVGHTMIVGPTGGGKTVLMNFLCAQAMKFSPRLFFFDKDRGAEIFIRALGGVYEVIRPRTKGNLNPLQMEDTPENRSFLLEWFVSLASVYGDKVTSDDLSLINLAIEGNFKLKKSDRRLRNLIPFLGLDTPGSLVSRMAIWFGNGSHASIFDNEQDLLDFSRSRVFGFEMADLLKDQICLGPVLLYIFHRISTSLDGTPSMIVLDEAWALIGNAIFAPKIKDWLKVLRKLNTFVVFATQSVEDASKSDISDTLVQQTATQIFLPNLKATEAYKTVFMLTEREFALVKSTDPGSRFFLLKRGTSSVIARIDLRGMDNVINVLSGRSDTVQLLHGIINEFGSNPKVWLPIFYKRVKNA